MIRISCSVICVVLTNPENTRGSAEDRQHSPPSRFKPFSDFLDRYILDKEIARFALVPLPIMCRTPYARIISIIDRLTGENVCAKVITKDYCNPCGILVLDPDVLTSIRHKNIIQYYDIYESDQEIIVTIERFALVFLFILEPMVANCSSALWKRACTPRWTPAASSNKCWRPWRICTPSTSWRFLRSLIRRSIATSSPKTSCFPIPPTCTHLLFFTDRTRTSSSAILVSAS